MPFSPPSIRVQVPAKVNLHLGVGPLREDGFHELVTVFQAVDLHDRITASGSQELRLELTGEGADELPRGPGNLAWRAANTLAHHTRCVPAVTLAIDKQIPIAGGMAGGSADAAGTLVACNALWGAGASKPDLHALAASLGSDVPFALMGGTALGTGRGEQLTSVLTVGTLHWVFAFADFGISAGEAYRELDRLRTTGEAPEPAGPPDELLDALRGGDAVRAGAALRNDLEAAAISLRPSLRATLDAGMDRGAVAAIVSGSGPTCAFLCRAHDDADDLAGALVRLGVCRDARAAVGPVPGARPISSADQP